MKMKIVRFITRDGFRVKTAEIDIGKTCTFQHTRLYIEPVHPVVCSASWRMHLSYLHISKIFIYILLK